MSETSLSYRFCPKCGGELARKFVEQEGHHRLVCQSCGFIFYLSSKPTASALVIRDGKVLLVERAIEPYKGWWDVPGGFTEDGEHPEEAVRRELREETGLEIRILGLLGIFMDAYVYGSVEDHTLNLYYLAEPIGGDPWPGSDAASLGWFGKDELPDRVAFQCSRDALVVWRGSPPPPLTAEAEVLS